LLEALRLGLALAVAVDHLPLGVLVALLVLMQVDLVVLAHYHQ
jgi:hypothetical protein